MDSLRLPSDLRPARASALETLAVLRDVVLPTFAKGVILRRPTVVKLSARLGLERRAIRRLQQLRAKYGEAPLLLEILGRQQLVAMAPHQVARILEEMPPFSPATTEKRAALAHFEPHVSLVSTGTARAERRRLNDTVLESGVRQHSLAPAMFAAMREEAQRLARSTRNELDWPTFHAHWHGAVRRIVLGQQAREDRDLTVMLDKLRGAGNWAFMHPGRKQMRRALHDRLAGYVERAESGSLASIMSRNVGSGEVHPTDQLAHYLFAFDAGGIATFRALALLVAHADHMRKARDESGQKGMRPFLRACVLETLRLWPTTPAVLRQSTAETMWGGETLPTGTGFFIYAPFFHRDDERLAFADTFSPEIWDDREANLELAFVPFSAGPGICPGRHIVTMTASAMLAGLLLHTEEITFSNGSKLQESRRMPALLDHVSLRFRLSGATRRG